MKLTQENLVLNFLATGGRLSSRKARQLHIENPSAVINNLRRKGHVIYSNRRKTGAEKSFWTLSFGLNEVANGARVILREAVVNKAWL